MKYVPHDYQTYATDFILSHPVAAVLLQMGLGKSVITLTALKELFERGEISRVLVVAPLRVARDTWPEELRKWDHLKDLTYSVAVGTAEERRAALSRDVQIHIINRENVVWMMESGLKLSWDMIVIDELSSFKSWQSKRFRALLKLRPFVGRIVGLTGTPAGNGLMDLFAEYRLLDQGERLGKFIRRYREEFFLPDKRSATQIYTWRLRPGAEEEIYRRIGDITVSMKSVDHLKMPEYVSGSVLVHMDEEERKYYETLKEELILRVAKRFLGTEPVDELFIDAKNAAVLCGKLCQMAGGACYAEDGSIVRFHDRKLDALEDLIEASAGHPLLIAYWYQHDLMRIRERFPEVRPLRTQKDMRDWNEGKIPLAAIHPASAGHGLNLQQGGNTLVWFGLTWSLELYQQTNARLWRQGQQAKTVVIHHLVCEGTIDERILSALKNKDRSQESLIDAVRWSLEREDGTKRAVPPFPDQTVKE